MKDLHVLLTFPELKLTLQEGHITFRRVFRDISADGNSNMVEAFIDSYVRICQSDLLTPEKRRNRPCVDFKFPISRLTRTCETLRDVSCVLNIVGRPNSLGQKAPLSA